MTKQTPEQAMLETMIFKYRAALTNIAIGNANEHTTKKRDDLAERLTAAGVDITQLQPIELKP